MLWFAALLLVPQTQCAAMDVNSPAPLAAWATPGAGHPRSIVTPLTVVGIESKYVTGLPEGAKPGRAISVKFSVDAPGAYGIAIDQPAWIDVVPAAGGVPLKSAKHGHGPECSTIRKIVRFDLTPGSYTIYLSGMTSTETAKVKVMLVAPE